MSFILDGFTGRVGKRKNVNDVIDMFGKNRWNSNGNLLIELLQNCNIIVCNGRTLLPDPRWTQVQSCLGHKSSIDFIITDKAFIK